MRNSLQKFIDKSSTIFEKEAETMTAVNLMENLDNKTRQKHINRYCRTIKQILLGASTKINEINSSAIKKSYNNGKIDDRILQACITYSIKSIVKNYTQSLGKTLKITKNIGKKNEKVLEEITANDADLKFRRPDHSYIEEEIAYAIHHNLINSKEIEKILFQHGDSAETFSEKYYTDMIEKTYEKLGIITSK